MDPQELEKFRISQKTAYRAVMETIPYLSEGMTEIEAARILDENLKQKGINNFFHTAFAWFGERTAFRGMSHPFQFLPTDKKLEKGMAVILDVAPAPEGYASDIGFSFSFGENSLVERGKKDLQMFRELILDGVRGEKPISWIYRDVDILIQELGYYNCHQKYPLSVLGHKVGKMGTDFSFNFFGFSLQTYLYLLGESLDGMNPFEYHYKSHPYWNRNSKFISPPGLYAVEPHIGIENVGVKFEEILVITDYDAFWLDDDLPHVTYWETV